MTKMRGARLLSLPFVAGGVALAGSLSIVAVPTIQGVYLARRSRPSVPGPHPQDGLFGPPHAAIDEPVTLVWLGDSLASGVGAATPDASFPRKAAALASASVGRPMHLTCLAKPGATTGDVLRDQVPAAIGLLGPGAVAVVTAGSNDIASVRPRRFHKRYREVLDALAGTGATVVAVGLPHIGSATVFARPLRNIVGGVGRVADWQVRRLAKRHGAHYVHIAVRAPRGATSESYLAADRYHPNDATYQLWADRFAARLRAHLSAATATA